MRRKHTHWKPPDFGQFKVNYDGAIFREQGRAGIGVVIRNSDGAVLASLSQQIPLPTIVAQVEALAARRAAEFALEIGIDQVIIEGDFEVIYKDLIDPRPSLAQHRHLICDVLHLAIVFSLCSFNNVGWTGNNVAHNLARRAISTHDLNVWIEEVPPDILQFVQADLTALVNWNEWLVSQKKTQTKPPPPKN